MPVGVSSESTAFGWRRLVDYNLDDTELRVVSTLSTDFGANVNHAGDRSQSYDLEIVSPIVGRPNPYLSIVGLSPGRYEIKSLWMRESGTFDPRFKLGQRGEKVYGRRDAQVKSFAQCLESELDNIIEHSVVRCCDNQSCHHPRAEAGTVASSVLDIHDIVDRAMARRHSKSFMERILRLAEVSVGIPRLTVAAQLLRKGGITQADIAKGFEDIEGIFIVAGHTYTLVSKDEYAGFLAFDSASSEGPKLRYVKAVPSEETT